MNIHPFPARMAPELVDEKISELPDASDILDPMCGSGTTLRRSLEAGHSASGWDIDPLAVKMSRVRCRRYDTKKLLKDLDNLLVAMKEFEADDLRFLDCEETLKFSKYWFAENQRNDLNALSLAIDSCFPNGKYKDFFQIALSRIVITKFKGASLAWDISHSRPHKKKEENKFETISEFSKSALKLIHHIENHPCPQDAKIELTDCRTQKSDQKFDAIITSPPYLNAIDYMRGHKFSLIWMGHNIPELRKIRGTSIGSESKRPNLEKNKRLNRIAEQVCSGRKINKRTRGILIKYVDDCDQFIASLQNHLKPRGNLVLVVANSMQYGTRIKNDQILETIAQEKGFTLAEKKQRHIPASSRYLPARVDGQIGKRMKTESVLHFCKA